MSKETAEALARNSANGWEDALEIHEGYSGRGMCGETTYAVSGHDIEPAIVDTVIEAFKAKNDGMIHELRRGFRRDALGLGKVWY